MVMSNPWAGRVSYYDNIDSVDFMIDGRVIGCVDFGDVDESDLKDCCDNNECHLTFVNGEGDVDIPNGWHEWIDCEPEYGQCMCWNELIEDALNNLAECNDYFEEWFEECKNENDIIETLKWFVSENLPPFYFRVA